MKKGLFIAALASLVFTSQARAQLDFHYNWLDQTIVDPCFWIFGGGHEAPPATGISPEGHFLLDTWEEWASVWSVDRVVRPAPDGTIEMIADLYQTESQVHFNAMYESGHPRPEHCCGSPGGCHTCFNEASMALGMSVVDVFAAHNAGWTICVNTSCTQPPEDPNQPYPPLGDGQQWLIEQGLGVRIRLSATPGAGIQLDWRFLDVTTGQFAAGSDWTPVPATHVAEDLDIALAPDDDPPFRWAFPNKGRTRWGMIEVYQNTGNDGTLPAPGNALDDRPPGGYPQLGFQDPRGECDLPGGTCDELTAADCATAGGTYQGDGTSCPTGPCDLPVTSSCGEGCLILTSGKCAAEGGTYLGDGASCPTGACRLPGGTCAPLTSGECVALGGTYDGDGTPCTTGPSILDYHYNWVGQTDIDPGDWFVGPGFDQAGVTSDGRLFLDSSSAGGGSPWHATSSVDRVVRPNSTTGAVELIVDIWAKDGQTNFSAHGPPLDLAGFSDLMMLGATHTGTSDWVLCINPSLTPPDQRSCVQQVGAFTNDLPIRMRVSAIGQSEQNDFGANLDARRLDPATGQFIGDWFPVPSIRRAIPDLPLNEDPPFDPPWKFGFSILGHAEIGMVEVYQSLQNDGTIPAPGNTNGATPPGGFPPNGTQTGLPNNDQIAGDCNQDGDVDLSDAICLLGFLFQNDPATLPCNTTNANNTLMNVNGDNPPPDLSDAIYLLTWLFQGGTPPVQGTGCFSIAGCPQNEGC